jgi:hypothetical protein
VKIILIFWLPHYELDAYLNIFLIRFYCFKYNVLYTNEPMNIEYAQQIIVMNTILKLYCFTIMLDIVELVNYLKT